MTSLDDVCLIIASFQNDDAIARLLEGLFAGGTGSPFHRVIIVDSQGTPAIPALIKERGWVGVDYHSFEGNLGSAGNLSKRLLLAARTKARFAYAINHDAVLNVDVVRALRGASDHEYSRLGALYPLRYIPGRDSYDVTGRQRLPLPFSGSYGQPEKAFVEVSWSSSNGALYALEPVRKGLIPWDGLWMGWEDMGYGWLLQEHGYRQFIVTGAQVNDDYEYRNHKLMGVEICLSDKPSWYAYYHSRNLLLVSRKYRKSAPFYAVVGARLLQELGLIALFRGEKATRFSLLGRGFIDGLLNRSGKGIVP